LGITFVSSVGNKLYYNTPVDYDGLPINMKIYVSNVQVASVTINNPYLNQPFVFERTVGGVTTQYYGLFNSTGRIDF
jgi:hypothetical protein